MNTEELMSKALCRAQEAFEDYLEKDNVDASYFDIRFTVWLKDAESLRRFKKVEIESEIENADI